MSTSELLIDVLDDGSLAAIHNDALTDLYGEGQTTIRRASNVEPVMIDGKVMWVADMSPVDGPKLEPHSLRSDALAAEVVWLQENGF